MASTSQRIWGTNQLELDVNGRTFLACAVCSLATAFLISIQQPAGAQEGADQVVRAVWQTVTWSGDGTMRRTQIPAGWLLTIEHNNTITTTVVSDPEHEWLNVEAERTAFGAYVAADRATYDLLKPHFSNYHKYVLREADRAAFKETLDAWKNRIEAAEEQHR
jgi:hypothetical protein